MLVIGAGGLGSPALLYLAAAGVGRITVLDTDVVDVSNLQRQVLFTTSDAEARAMKAVAAARRLRELNPLIEIEGLAERFSKKNAAGLVASHDVVLDASDNFSTRYLVNDACVLGGRPFVYGAIQGFEGQASVFNWRGGPTYRCLFPNPAAASAVQNCAEAGVLPGLVGVVQATEAIKLLTGIGEPLSGRLWIWDALGMRSRELKIARDPKGKTITELPDDDETGACANAVEVPDEIGAEELAELMKGGGVQLLDVREPWERLLGAIKPSAHAPLGKLAGEKPALDPERRTVVYCAAGVRSLKALGVLREKHGFARVQSLRGGMAAWKI